MKYGALLFGSRFACLIFMVSTAYAIHTYEFEFGTDQGELVHSAEGKILPFHYITTKYIPVPPTMKLAYIKVVINSLSPPKVDYNSSIQKATIRFSITQIPVSTYSIVGKAVPMIN